MADTIQLDAKGMRCPRPIIELAKVRRTAGEGTIIEITADDLAFESDVTAWCETTGNPLIELIRTGDEVFAKIEIK